MLDVIFGEDTAIKLERNEKANIALLTRTALNLIRANGDANLSVKRHKIRASQNTAFREKLLFAKFYAFCVSPIFNKKLQKQGFLR